MKIIVPGHPVPAVRMTQRGKFIKKSAGRYLAYKNHIGWCAKAAGIKQITGDVEVIGIAYIHGNKSGDIDNLAKAWLDGLNGIAFIDDGQVKRLTVEKRKASSKDEERAEIEIREAKQEPDMVLVDRNRLSALEEMEKELLRWVEENKAK
jgi:Holliday junction resolvase RusA-like endonuclease